MGTHFFLRIAIAFTLISVIVHNSYGGDKCTDPHQVTASSAAMENRWTECNGTYIEQFAVPRGVAAFPYPQQILTGPYGGYKQVVKKIDIVWAADSITVDSPLRSFGGDIIIIANKLTINAPIDSRIYVEHDVDFFEPDHDGRQRADIAHAYGGFRWGLDSRPLYRKTYDDYYLHCFDCVPGETRRAQLPSGLAAAMDFGAGNPFPRFDGEAAPDTLVEFANTRSGNIYIFAKEIIVSDKLSTPVILDDFSECSNPNSQFVPYAINAGGLQGGRGGAGSPSQCITHNPAGGGFDCMANAYSERGGLSGNGGRGGDAGDIYVGMVNVSNEASLNSLGTLLKTVTNVAGGTPGSNKKYSSPSALGPAAAQGTRCSFAQGLQAEQYPQAITGTNGTLTIQQLSAIDLLNRATRLLNGKDARLDYDFYSYIQIARIDPSLQSFTFASALEQFLSTELAQTQVRFAGDVDRVFGLGQSESQRYLNPIFTGISAASLDEIPFAAQQGAVARELQRFDQGADGVGGVFRQSGGVFHVASKNTALARMSAGQLLVEVSQVNVTLTEVADTLRSIDSQFFRMLSKSELDTLKLHINQTQAELSRLEEELAKQNADGGLNGLIQIVQKCGQAVGAIATAIGTEDPIAIAGALKNGVDVYQQLTTKSGTASLQSIQAVKDQLKKMQEEFDSLEAFVSRKKIEYLQREYQNVQQMLNARTAYRSKLNADSFQFEDLLKVSLISYFDDTAKDKGKLRSNIQALQTYLREFPFQQPFIRLSDIDFSCSGATRCRTIQAAPYKRELYFVQTVGGKRREIPLYELGSLETTVTLPTFLVDPDQILIRRVR
jgi:hypothetical protein